MAIRIEGTNKKTYGVHAAYSHFFPVDEIVPLQKE
jgi:hypothetical protein